jgi:hypothetical protein
VSRQTALRRTVRLEAPVQAGGFEGHGGAPAPAGAGVFFGPGIRLERVTGTHRNAFKHYDRLLAVNPGLGGNEQNRVGPNSGPVQISQAFIRRAWVGP